MTTRNISLIPDNDTCREAVNEAAQRLHDGDDHDEVIGDLAVDLFYITYRSLGMTDEEIDAEWETDWEDFEDDWLCAAEDALG